MVYQKLRGRIRECGFTEKSIATYLNLSPSMISMKMHGKIDWKKEEMTLICKVLNISPSDIPIYFFAD